MLPGKQYAPEELLEVLRHRIWWVVVPFALVSAASAAIARALPDYYRSDALIMVTPQRLPESYVKSTVTMRIEDRLQSIKQQILSRTHLEKIIHDFDLYADRRPAIMQDVVEQMGRDIEIRVAQGDVVRLSYTGSEPRTVMKVTDALASLFINESLRDRETLAEGTNQFFQAQLEAARERLRNQEKKLESYRMRYSGQLPTQLSSNLEALHNVEMRIQSVVEAINRDSQQKLLLERQLADLEAPPLVAPRARPEASPADPVAMTAEEQLAYQHELLKALENKGATAVHPDVVAARRAIRDLQAKVDAEAAERAATNAVALTQDQIRQRRAADVRAELEQTTGQIARAREEEARLRASSAEYQAKIDAVPARETEMTELTRDYTTLSEMYTSLLQKNEESKISENLERRQIGEQFNLLDPAHLPEKPVRPNRPLSNAIAMVGGLMLGLTLAGLVEYRDSSFKSDSDVTRVLSLPVLAVVPLMRSDADRRREIRRRWLIRMALGGTVSACLAVVVYTFVR